MKNPENEKHEKPGKTGVQKNNGGGVECDGGDGCRGAGRGTAIPHRGGLRVLYSGSAAVSPGPETAPECHQQLRGRR